MAGGGKVKQLMSTRFNLPGPVGNYVRATSFEERAREYLKNGLGKMLGPFVGSPRQNQALLKTKQLPHLATGGVVTSPTVAVIGEKGPEAVVPLTAPQATPTAPPTPAVPATSPPPAVGTLDGGQDKSGYGSAVPPANPVLTPGSAPAQPLNVDTSIVDYLKSTGKPSDFASRTALAQQYGVNNYTGTAEQNIGLLKTLKAGQATPVADPQTPATPPVSDNQDTHIADQYAATTGSDLKTNAQDIASKSGGTLDANDIISTVMQSPQVIAATDYHDRIVSSNNNVLTTQVQKLAGKEGISEQALTMKANVAKYRLGLAMERRGLVGSGIQQRGEQTTDMLTSLNIQRLRQGLTDSQQNLVARTLARNERIDISLAKTIVTAANAEFKARQKLADDKQKAVDTFLKSQGYVTNPSTGEIVKSAAETRSEASASRAEASATRADANSKATQARADARLHMAEAKFQDQKSKKTPQNTVLTKQQYARLESAGIPQGLAYSLTSDILSGTSLDQIRQDLVQHNQDPKLLDRYDGVVGIASLLKYQKPKAASTSGGRAI